jgi:hypothetical protein
MNRSGRCHTGDAKPLPSVNAAVARCERHWLERIPYTAPLPSNIVDTRYRAYWRHRRRPQSHKPSAPTSLANLLAPPVIRRTSFTRFVANGRPARAQTTVP